jgi:hypothetical protein
MRGEGKRARSWNERKKQRGKEARKEQNKKSPRPLGRATRPEHPGN